MNRVVFLSMSLLLSIGCTTTGHYLDSAGSLYALSNPDFVELNPVAIPAKVGLEVWAEAKERDNPALCHDLRVGARSGSWFGATASAVGFVGGPIGLAVAAGAGTAYLLWDWVDKSAVKSCYGELHEAYFIVPAHYEPGAELSELAPTGSHYQVIPGDATWKLLRLEQTTSDDTRIRRIAEKHGWTILKTRHPQII
jgi:hypothetical protein